MTFKNNQSNLCSLLCSRICAGLHWFQFSLCFASS